VKLPLLLAINGALLAAIVFAAFFWEPAGAPGAPAATVHALPAPALAPPPPGGDFTLAGPGGPASLRDHAGKVVLLYFGYTYCPDVCPTSLMVWQEALGQLDPAELARVQPIFISVDPQRDDTARLQEYARFFHPVILGLTGPEDRLREIAGRYGAVFERRRNASAGGDVIDHTSVTYLIDPQGRLAERLPHGATAAQLLGAIRQHLPKP